MIMDQRVLNKRYQSPNHNTSMNEPKSYGTFDSIQPLPRRAPPVADEDLLSIIRRTASHMGYKDMRWLFRPEGNRWNMKEIDIPLLSSDEASYVLQRLLLLSKEQLYNHTVHRFAAPLEYTPHKTSQGDQKYSQQVSTSTQQKLLSSSTLKTHQLVEKRGKVRSNGVYSLQPERG